MEKNKGWISLHRKFLDWEWYDDANTMRLFIHLLLCANHQNNKWRGVLIQRGQLISSQPKLANSLKLSISQIRNSLSKLKSTGEITVYPTADYSIITIKNYSSYQDDSSLNDRLETDKEQASNRLATTNNNDNNSTINEYINNTHTIEKNVCVKNPNLSEEDLKLLRKYAKENGAKNLKPYVATLISNGAYVEILKEEKKKAAKREAEQLLLAEREEEQEIQEPELTEEERQAFLQKMREKAGITGNKRRSKK